MTRTMIFAVAILLTAIELAAAQSQQRSFYDRNGSFSGSSTTRDNTTSAYDKSGKFDVSAIRNSDGTTSLYDRSGRFTGSSINRGPRR
jgi:hypothetical protein